MSYIYSQLIKAQMENLSSDPSSPSTGLFYFNTTSNIPKWYNGSGWKTFLAADFSNVTGTLGISNGGTGQTTATAAFNALDPQTTKGDLISHDGTNSVRVGIGADGTIPIADASQTVGWRWGANTPTLDSTNEITNLALAVSVSANALTVALKDKSGADPTSGSPVKTAFRNATATTGNYTVRSVSSALSMTVSSGSTLGHANNTQSYIYVYLLDNAGTVELAVSSYFYDDGSVQSTTAEGGAGGADSASVIYSTTARSNVPIRLIGRISSTQTTAGTWASTPAETTVGHFLIRPLMLETTAGPTACGTGTQTTVGSLTLTPGTWLVSASATSDGNTGVIGCISRLYIKGANGGANGRDILFQQDDGASGVRMASSTTFAARLVTIAPADSDKTIQIKMQPTGATSNCNGYISAIYWGSA